MDGKRKSVRVDIISFLSAVMAVTILVVGIIVFISWRNSSEEMIGIYEEDVHLDIVSEMERYLDTPLRINMTNHYSVMNGIVDIGNAREREIFFAGILKSTDSSVYSFSYGTEDGEYHGARRNLKDGIEIVRGDASTSGNFAYYETNEDLTAGKLLGQVGEFDPRTRGWYKIAKEKGEPVFSPTYTNFLLKDLAITAAYPVYDAKGTLKGVLGTHFIVSNISGFLNRVVAPKEASVFIFEKNTGEVIASTQDLPKFMSFPDRPMERVTIEQLDNDLFTKAYQEYRRNDTHDFVVDAKDETYGVRIMEYQRNGLDWILITAIPRGQFFSPIMRGFWVTLAFFLLAMLVTLAILLRRVNIFMRPIDHLTEVAEGFTEGRFTQRAKVFRNDEVGNLSLAFNSMAERFSTHMTQSEERMKVKRTALEKSNSELTEAAEKVRNTFKSMGRGFISTDRFGDVAMMNKEAETLTGWTEEDAVGVPVEDVFNVYNAKTGERCHNMVVRVFEHGEHVEFDCEPVLISREGVETPIAGIASPIEDGQGVRSGVVILFAKGGEKRDERLHRISS